MKFPAIGRTREEVRGLLDEAGIPATGGVEPPAREPTLF